MRTAPRRLCILKLFIPGSLRDQGELVDVHFLGREWLAGLHQASPEQVPHELPNESQLAALMADLPLRQAAFIDEAELYLSHLQAR